MQIDSIASTIASTASPSPAASSAPAISTQISHNSKAQGAVVEQTSSGYEAYIPAPPGPVVTGSSIEVVEQRLNSTVQFQGLSPIRGGL